MIKISADSGRPCHQRGCVATMPAVWPDENGLISRGGQVSVNVIVHVDALVYIASDCVFCSSEP